MTKYLYAKHLYWLLVLRGVDKELALVYVKHIISQVSKWHWADIKGLELIQAWHQSCVYMKLWHTTAGIYRTRRKHYV